MNILQELRERCHEMFLWVVRRQALQHSLFTISLLPKRVQPQVLDVNISSEALASVDDGTVASASAEVSSDWLLSFGNREASSWAVWESWVERNAHPRRAETALRGVEPGETAVDWVETFFSVSETFWGCDGASVYATEKCEARVYAMFLHLIWLWIVFW